MKKQEAEKKWCPFDGGAFACSTTDCMAWAEQNLYECKGCGRTVYLNVNQTCNQCGSTEFDLIEEGECRLIK